MALTPWALPPDEDPQLVTARTRIGFALALLGARRRRRGDVDVPLSPLEVTALAELAVRVCSLPGQRQELYALALAFDATLPRKLVAYGKVRSAYKLALLENPSLDKAGKVAMVRRIMGENAAPEEVLPGRPLDPRTEAEAALELGGWSDAAIALLTDPDREPWQEGQGARRVSLRLARYRKWCSGVFGPPACFFSKVNPRNSASRPSRSR